jgi:hypothetical protein
VVKVFERVLVSVLGVDEFSEAVEQLCIHVKKGLSESGAMGVFNKYYGTYEVY